MSDADSHDEINCKLSFILDHRTSKMKAWSFYIHMIAIISSFLYAHYAAYRHEDGQNARFMYLIELSFAIDFLVQFNMTFDDPRSSAFEPISSYE